jgi:hypothetical protein
MRQLARDDSPGERGRRRKRHGWAAMRPSTLLRIARLDALVAAFSARDLGPAGIATLLRCSGSCARNYVTELVDAGMIKPMPAGLADRGVDKNVYRLTSNRRLVDAFLASLEACRAAAPACAPQVADQVDGHYGANTPGRFADRANRAGANMVARRDPLVAALFGAPGRDSQVHTWQRAGERERSPSFPPRTQLLSCVNFRR